MAVGTPNFSLRLPTILLVLVVAAAVAPFLLLSYFNHPFLDDYYNAANVRATGLWAQQLDMYLHWTGRFSTSLLVTAANPLVYGWYEGFRLAPALVLVATLAIVYLGLRTISQQLPRPLAVLTAAIFLIFYLNLIPEPYTAIYWFTGSVVYHIAGLALMLVFIASERARLTESRSRRLAWQLLAMGSAVTAAAANEMTLLHLLLILALLLAVSWHRRHWMRTRWWGSLMALTLLVAIVTVVAPGNYARMQLEGYSKDFSGASIGGQLWQAVLKTPQVVFDILVGRGRSFKLLLPTLLWLPTALHWQRRGWINPTIRLSWQLGALFMLASLVLSIFMFVVLMGKMPPMRAVNGLLLFLFPAGLVVIWAALAYHVPHFSWRLPQWLQHWGPVVFIAAISLASLPRKAWLELVLNASSYDQQLLAREEQMRSAWLAGKEHVVVKPIIGIKPYRVLVIDWDLTTDPTNYVNTETALFFDFKTIVIDKQLLPNADPEFHYF